MNFIKIAITFFCIVSTLLCNAQDPNRKHSIGLYQNFTDYNVRILDNKIFAFDSSLSHSTRFAYQRKLSRTWMLNTGVSNGFILNQNIKKEFVSKAYALGLDVSVLFKLNNGRIIKEDAHIAPYFTFGYRTDYVPKLTDFNESPWLFHNQYGAGMNIRLAERTHFQIQAALDQKLLGDFSTQVQYRMGITQSLGKWGSNLPKSKPSLDSDQDGIVDADDKCPGQYGLIELGGCPDTLLYEVNKNFTDSVVLLLKIKSKELELMELELARLKNAESLSNSNEKINANLLIEVDKLNAELEKRKVLDSLEADTVYVTQMSEVSDEADSIASNTEPKFVFPEILIDQDYYVITISSPNLSTAEAWLQKMLKDFKDAQILPQPNGYYRVGVYVGKELARGLDILEKVKQIGYDPAWLSIE